MSNVPGGIQIATCVDSVVDFTSKPAYLANDNKVDSAFFNVLPINNYSSSLISVKINLSNAMSQVLDRVMIMTVPIQFNITGSRVGGSNNAPLLADGEFGVRSNAFLKCCNVSSALLGSAANYSFQSDSGIIINALESSGPMPSWSRQLNNIDNQLVDNVVNYDDSLYTNRSVLGLFNSNSGCDMGRAAYDITVSSNTPTAATIVVNFRFAVFVSPFLQDIHVNGGQAGLSHLDSVNLNFALTNLNTRLLSFARKTNNGTLKIDNVQPLFGPNVSGLSNPVLEFSTYNIISSYFKLPPQVNYKLPVIDRYSTLIGVASGSTATVSTPVVSLNSVPSYALIWACYPESLYSSQNFSYGQETNIHGSQLTDSFCPIQTVNAQINSVNQMNNSTQQTLWKSYVNNGGCKSFVEWSGKPVIKTLLDPSGNPKYMYPASGPVKLNFGTDLHVRSPDGTSLSSGTNFKFNSSFTITLINTMPYTDQLVLYVAYCYPQLIVSSGVNNTQIVVSPLSVEDNLSFKDQQPTGHASSFNTHDLVGYGLMGKMHRMIDHPKFAHKMRKHRLHKRHLKDHIKHHMPEMEKLAMVQHGMGVSGGKQHSKKKSKKSRKSALKF